MSIQITHVRFGGTQRTEDQIVRYRYVDLGSRIAYESDKPSLVARVDGGLAAYVSDGATWVTVQAVHPHIGNSYLRTFRDGRPTNNLVNLPTF